MTKPFDPTKPVQTRGGLPARIICTNKKGGFFPIVALITGDTGLEYTAHRGADGRALSDLSTQEDLINVPEQTIRYLNVYPDNAPFGHESTAKADVVAGIDRTSIAEITVEDGEIVSVKTVWKKDE